MLERDETRNRIRRRRNNCYINYEGRFENKQFSLIHIFMFIIVIFFLFFGAFGFDGGIKLMQKYTANIQQIIPWSKIIPFERWGLDFQEDSSVSSVLGYYKSETIGFYTSDSNSAKSLGDGLVVYIGENKGSKFIVVSHDNGVSVTYGNLRECHVQLYDRVIKGSTLGVFTDLIKLEAMRDSMDLDMEEVFILFED